MCTNGLDANALLRQEFSELCSSDNGDARLGLQGWLQWRGIRDQIGPPGSNALLTPIAAEKIWGRVATTSDSLLWKDLGSSVALDGFLELAEAVEQETKRATAIQALVRARRGRMKAEKAQASKTVTTIDGVVALAPFNPTPDCAIAQALDALDVNSRDVLYDLGCGDGRLLLAAAARGATCVGVEYDRELAQRAQDSVAKLGLEGSVRVVHGDASTVDLAPATKIFVYLVPTGLQHMAPKLDDALRRGVWIASYTFSLPGWEAIQTLTAESRAPECKVRLYQGATACRCDETVLTTSQSH